LAQQEWFDNIEYTYLENYQKPIPI